MNPLVSICVPLYNKAAYVERTLMALLAQTYPNVEIVVLDNASTDGGGDAAEAIANGTQHVRLHRIDCTISQNESWRYVMRLAKGEFVNLHRPPDTTLDSQWVEKMVTPLLADPTLGFTVCDTNIVSAPGFNEQAANIMVNCHRGITAFGKALLSTDDPQQKIGMLLSECLENRVGTPYAALVRHTSLPWSHWQKTESYWPESYADWDFMFRLFLKHKGAFVDDVKFDYHLDFDGGFWKTLSGHKKTAIHDKMYRLMMPITILTDSELADVRKYFSMAGTQMILTKLIDRLWEASQLSDAVAAEAKGVVGL